MLVACSEAMAAPAVAAEGLGGAAAGAPGQKRRGKGAGASRPVPAYRADDWDVQKPMMLPPVCIQSCR